MGLGAEWQPDQGPPIFYLSDFLQTAASGTKAVVGPWGGVSQGHSAQARTGRGEETCPFSISLSSWAILTWPQSPAHRFSGEESK